jgi:hypothetical protein
MSKTTRLLCLKLERKKATKKFSEKVLSYTFLPPKSQNIKPL